jgi:ketosteroid isomerase-like protein
MAGTPSSATTAFAVAHVRLSYEYLDAGDLDGYASLLHEHVQVKRPDAPDAHGRPEVLRLMAPLSGPPGKHHLYKVIADGDCVAALGRFSLRTPSCPQDTVDVDFADFVIVSDEALLLGVRRFYYASPD